MADDPRNKEEAPEKPANRPSAQRPHDVSTTEEVTLASGVKKFTGPITLKELEQLPDLNSQERELLGAEYENKKYGDQARALVVRNASGELLSVYTGYVSRYDESKDRCVDDHKSHYVCKYDYEKEKYNGRYESHKDSDKPQMFITASLERPADVKDTAAASLQPQDAVLPLSNFHNNAFSMSTGDINALLWKGAGSSEIKIKLIPNIQKVGAITNPMDKNGFDAISQEKTENGLALPDEVQAMLKDYFKHPDARAVGVYDYDNKLKAILLGAKDDSGHVQLPKSLEWGAEPNAKPKITAIYPPIFVKHGRFTPAGALAVPHKIDPDGSDHQAPLKEKQPGERQSQGALVDDEQRLAYAAADLSNIEQPHTPLLPAKGKTSRGPNMA